MEIIIESKNVALMLVDLCRQDLIFVGGFV